MIEGKGNLDFELLHDDFANAVCEAPILIVELLKGLLGKHEISGGDLMNFCKAVAKEPCAKQ